MDKNLKLIQINTREGKLATDQLIRKMLQESIDIRLIQEPCHKTSRYQEFQIVGKYSEAIAIITNRLKNII